MHIVNKIDVFVGGRARNSYAAIGISLDTFFLALSLIQ